MRIALRLSALVCLTFAIPTPATTPTPASLGTDTAGLQTLCNSYRPNEVRLRKMHLVRPDLIPYPTFQAFYA
jgi:hypothetical protein